MYQLIYLYLENSDSGEPNVKVRNFNKLEAARVAMNNHFEKTDAILHFPVGKVDDDHYTSRTENGVFVRNGIDTYHWEIEEVIPEDGAPELALKSESRTVRAVFDPEAGYPRMFLEIASAAGVLRATANTDEDYPEIYLDFADAKHQDEPERQVAVLQFGKAPEETGKGRLLVWGVDADESVTETFLVSQNESKMAKRIVKRCPKCGGDEFDVTAHVTQGWIVDRNGQYVSCTCACEEVTHTPDDDDRWTCHKCGYNAVGREFNVELKVPEVPHDAPW